MLKLSWVSVILIAYNKWRFKSEVDLEMTLSHAFNIKPNKSVADFETN